MTCFVLCCQAPYTDDQKFVPTIISEQYEYRSRHTMLAFKFALDLTLGCGNITCPDKLGIYLIFVGAGMVLVSMPRLYRIICCS